MPINLLAVPFFLLLSSYVRAELSIFPKDITLLKDTKELSEKCWEQIRNLDNITLLQMFDASTKVPNGLLYGNFFDLGIFDECYNIESDTSVGTVYGKYCLGTIPINIDGLEETKRTGIERRRIMIHPEPRMLANTDATGYHFAICVPSKCTAEEISIVSNFTEDFCYSKDTREKLSAGAIATITIISIFLGIVAASTIFDLYLFYTQKDSPHELLLAFSAFHNGRKLISSTTNPDQLLCLNGIKAISMMWVILGHNYSCALYAPVANFNDFLDFQKEAANMFMMSATVSVDSFFFVGGLVTVYTFLKSMDKGAKFNIFLFYLHRYLRLTPVLGIVVLIHANILRYLGNGPVWTDADLLLGGACRRGWWSTLLYIENYESAENYCVPQTWYLSVDMQLFVLSPIVLLPLVRWPKKTLYGLGFLTIAGVVVPLSVGYCLKLNAFTQTEDYFEKYYAQTYGRFGPYVMGMALGYFIYQIKKSRKEIRLNLWLVFGLWLISLGGLVACLYASYDLSVAEYDRWAHSLYLGFNRPAWALGLGIVILLCVIGYGGPIDAFLGHPIFQFLTKLSYSMYLIHYLLLKIKYSSMKTTFMFSNIEMMMQFWGIFMFTLALSLVLCLTFESPVIILEKFIFGGEKKVKSTKKPEV